MSKQAVESDRVHLGLKPIWLGAVELWEALRSRDASPGANRASANTQLVK